MTLPLARDRAWLEHLFVASHRQVLAYAVRRVPPDDAYDVVAEVFTAAWQHRAKVPDAALPWLYRTASHHVQHVWRSQGRSQRLTHKLESQPAAHTEDHAEGVVQRLDDASLVAAALCQLTPRDAEILRLAAWEGLNADELAYVMGCSRTAAKVRLHRARRRFEQAVAPPSTCDMPLQAREATS